MRQRSRVVQTPGRRPAIGAAKNGGVAVLTAHACQFFCDDPERFIPINLDKSVMPARAAIAQVALLEPALANRGTRNAQARLHQAGHGLQDAGRRAVAGKGLAAQQSPLSDDGGESAPVRQGWKTLIWIGHAWALRYSGQRDVARLLTDKLQACLVDCENAACGALGTGPRFRHCALNVFVNASRSNRGCCKMASHSMFPL